MLCNRGCGCEATYFSKNKNEWVCHKVPTKCSVVADKISATRKQIFKDDPSKHNAWGRVLSDDTKRKIGEKTSIALRGKLLTEEHKANISKGNLGKIQTEETKNKIRQSNVEHWAENSRIPWNKDKKGLQTAWNKGRKKTESSEILSRDDPIYSNFKQYRHRVGTKTKKTYEIYKNEINPLNLPRGKSGVEGAYHLDHIISVRIGFEQGISIEDMSSKENLQMLSWLDNIRKYDGKGNRKGNL